MNQAFCQYRRNFLRVSTAVSGGLIMAIQFPATLSAAPPVPDSLSADNQHSFSPNAWLHIQTDNTVIIRVASAEMGQGVLTSVPMMLAEELEVDWRNIKAEFAPVGDAYRNPLSHRQQTGGSTTIRAFFMPLRHAGASAKEMLIRAAALQWGVDPKHCIAKNGIVSHGTSGRTFRFGELATHAASLPVPKDASLKSPETFTLIGKPTKRLDAPEKVNGSAIFGQDVHLPDMLVAAIERPPFYGATLKKLNSAEAEKIAGVHRVINTEHGVAVVADHYWAADRGRKALQLDWADNGLPRINDETIWHALSEAIHQGTPAETTGDISLAKKTPGATTLSAEYKAPYLAHACMEPMNCTADIRDDGADIWVPTQGIGPVQKTVARMTGLDKEKINVHATFLGGGFGRRSEQDFVKEAVTLSQAVKRPVKVIWRREDDIRHDFFRPISLHKMEAVLNQTGFPIGWEHKLATPSILQRIAPFAARGGLDPTSTQGATKIAYDIEHRRVSCATVNFDIPVGFWRSVGHSQNTYVRESFIDEIAHAGKLDPLALRLRLLHNHPRYRQVLTLAAERAGWGTPLEKGRFQGIAVEKSFKSYVAQVVEVSVDANQRLTIHRVVCAVDCGLVINPSTVIAQMEGGIVFGLTAALMGKISVKNGQIQESNFHDYPLLRMSEMPKIDVHIVPSQAPPTGVGETAVPPIAPALVNAIFQATGKRIRHLPIRLDQT